MKKIRRGLWFDGKRRARFELTIPGTARRRRRSVLVTTRAEAESAFKAFREEVLGSGGVEAALRHETLEQYVRRNWPISRDARKPISPATARREWCSLTRRIFPALGSLRPAQITDQHVEDLAATLLKLGHQNSSVNDHLRTLHKVLAHSERRGKHVVPALRCWPSPLAERDVHQELTPDEARRFLGTFDTTVIPVAAGGEAASKYYTARFRWSKPMFVCAVHLGLARKDLLNLKWSSVDLERGLVSVERAKTQVRALIPISRAARVALLSCQKRAAVASDFVFTTPEGSRVPEVTWRRHFLVAKKNAGITRPLRPHDLRHSFGSLLRSKGVDLGLIQRAMGHSDARTTERYARVRIDALTPIRRALDSLPLVPVHRRPRARREPMQRRKKAQHSPTSTVRGGSRHREHPLLPTP
jgi:integrase